MQMRHKISTDREVVLLFKNIIAICTSNVMDVIDGCMQFRVRSFLDRVCSERLVFIDGFVSFNFRDHICLSVLILQMNFEVELIKLYDTYFSRWAELDKTIYLGGIV